MIDFSGFTLEQLKARDDANKIRVLEINAALAESLASKVEDGVELLDWKDRAVLDAERSKLFLEHAHLRPLIKKGNMAEQKVREDKLLYVLTAVLQERGLTDALDEAHRRIGGA